MERKFPRYLSSPYQVLMFEIDELMIILFLIVFWLIFGYVFFILLFICPYLYSKTKKKYSRGFFKHILYILGLIKFHGYPIHFEKKFIE